MTGNERATEELATGKRIICVEEEPDTALLITEELHDRGYEVSIATNGVVALTAILRNVPDLVLCDLNLPGMSGFELREASWNLKIPSATLPFIFLVAKSDRGLKARELHADEYVTKPINFGRLTTIIEARLSARSRQHRSLSRGITLSERELQCLTWAARGKSSLAIATILGVSKRTVDYNIDHARHKLNVSTRAQAVCAAMAYRLIEP
jgi:DNA-binding response OmpR family regulator